MIKLDRKWKIQLIHHSHTDIGYTERQERIELYHIDYIKQAIKISEAIKSKNKEWNGFVWTCETFWAVRLFFSNSSISWQKRFIDAVKRKHISISANYLNMNELISDKVLNSAISEASYFGKQHNLKIDSALTADINGYSWGYGVMRIYCTKMVYPIFSVAFILTMECTL